MILSKAQVKAVEELTGFKMLTEEQFRKLVYKAAKEYTKPFGYTEEFDEKEANEIVESAVRRNWERWLKYCFIKDDWASVTADEDGYISANMHVFMVDSIAASIGERRTGLFFEYFALCDEDQISLGMPLKWINGLSKIFGHFENGKAQDEN